MIPFQALAGNVGTCHSDVKGEIRVSSPYEEKSTDAGYRGGAARSSDDAFERMRSEGAASSGRNHEPTLMRRSS